jgi:hypothetical protein
MEQIGALCYVYDINANFDTCDIESACSKIEMKRFEKWDKICLWFIKYSQRFKEPVLG